MRKTRLKLNTYSSLFFQATTIVCGFILPRLILISFGSETNGLVNSINQFLQFIAFLDLGVGAVVQSSLYKPLAENNVEEISRIIKSAHAFFNKIAVGLVIYISFLILFFPVISKGKFDYLFSGSLIVAMSISFFAQYYLGVVDRLLLSADQKGYIHYTAQTVTLILNTLVSALLIRKGASIQIVKTATSVIYLIRPAVLSAYVRNKYHIDRNIILDREPIQQKWNGIAQHIAAIVLDGTDVIVLTLLSSFSNVSIYSVYHLVVNGVKQLFMSLTNGVQSLFGDMWARREYDKLNELFETVEWLIHTGVVFVFGCTMALIVPFIKLYTSGVDDINYVIPVFGVLITLANAGHCLRLPYNIMILAVGHYKQTQHNYIIAASINIVVSIVLVHKFGLIGVAVGTLFAMLYQTIWMAFYCYKRLLRRSTMIQFWKKILIDTICFGILAYYAVRTVFPVNNYLEWIVFAGLFSLLLALILVGINIVAYKDKIKLFKQLVHKRS